MAEVPRGRRFLCPQGLPWVVWEVSHEYLAQLTAEHAVHPGLADGWLCFEGNGQRRRLAPIPFGWAELTEPQLQLLCARAEFVPPGEQTHT